jgi:hypothetical protein
MHGLTNPKRKICHIAPVLSHYIVELVTVCWISYCWGRNLTQLGCGLFMFCGLIILLYGACVWARNSIEQTKWRRDWDGRKRFSPHDLLYRKPTHIKSSEILSLVLLSAYRWNVVIAVLLVVVGATTTNSTATPVPTVNQRRLLLLISSWWWAWGCPKHVELYLNDRQ